MQNIFHGNLSQNPVTEVNGVHVNLLSSPPRRKPQRARFFKGFSASTRKIFGNFRRRMVLMQGEESSAPSLQAPRDR
jgi:hypothetical protein